MGANPLDIVKLNIKTRPDHSYDIEDVAKFKNLEKIHMLTDEPDFVNQLVKNIDLFANLYELSVYFKMDKPPYYIELIDENCYDVSNILLIKNLATCTSKHEKEEVAECINCFTMYNLRNTRSSNCVIQNFTNDYLLNSMSNSIQKLIIVVNNPNELELRNLPFFLNALTIVYKTRATPREFYDEYQSKIKLPYGCKLKIIQDYDVSHLDIKDRHLNIDDEMC
jgi:hypothetical protein